jgi:hypothetical protein
MADMRDFCVSLTCLVRLGVLGKLLAGIGVVIVLLLIVAGTSVYSLRHAGDAVDALADVEMPG